MLQLKLLFTGTALALASVCTAQPASAAPPSRFAGSAGLTGPANISADARFKLDAAAFPPGTDFSEAKKTTANTAAMASTPKALQQLGGRFGLTAALSNQGVPAVACTGVDDIFKNGFE
jgi:hypothetical protein